MPTKSGRSYCGLQTDKSTNSLNAVVRLERKILTKKVVVFFHGHYVHYIRSDPDADLGSVCFN